MFFEYIDGNSLAILGAAAVGIWSGIAQGKAAAAALQLTAKRPDQMVKGIIYTAMVETYAIFALLVSVLIWLRIPV